MTVKLSEDKKKFVDELKVHPRQSRDEVIAKAMTCSKALEGFTHFALETDVPMPPGVRKLLHGVLGEKWPQLRSSMHSSPTTRTSKTLLRTP